MIWQGEELSPLNLGQVPFLVISFQWSTESQGSTTGKYCLSSLPQVKMVLQGLLKAGGMITKEMPLEWGSESCTSCVTISSITGINQGETVIRRVLHSVHQQLKGR